MSFPNQKRQWTNGHVWQLIIILKFEMDMENQKNISKNNILLAPIETKSPAEDKLASMWLEMFPTKAFDMVKANRLPAGARLVSTLSEITTPSCKETSMGFGISNKHAKQIHYWHLLWCTKWFGSFLFSTRTCLWLTTQFVCRRFQSTTTGSNQYARCRRIRPPCFI